jgi:hypothetical protein
LNPNTVNPYDAIKAALKDPPFTVTRGLWFFVSFQDKDGRVQGHANAVYYGQGLVNKFLFLDPNFGLWRGPQSGVMQAVRFLYSEKGPYRENYGLIVRGFEYSIWEKREKT